MMMSLVPLLALPIQRLGGGLVEPTILILVAEPGAVWRMHDENNTTEYLGGCIDRAPLGSLWQQHRDRCGRRRCRWRSCRGASRRSGGRCCGRDGGGRVDSG